MLLLSEGGFNTETVGATPLSSVDLIVKVFVVDLPWRMRVGNVGAQMTV